MSDVLGATDATLLTFPGFGPGSKLVVVRCEPKLGPGLLKRRESRGARGKVPCSMALGHRVRGRVAIDQSVSSGRATL